MYDFCIIGAGIVGLASAMEIARQKPNSKILILDKEHAVGTHRTGHNSGVIHAGVYYPPGSLKAGLCKEGASAVKAYFLQKGIEFEERGKLIVATSSEEVVRMGKLYANALRNGLEITLLSAHEPHELEPNISGEGALLVPASGIVDYKKICKAMATEMAEAGAELVLNCEVIGISERTHEVAIETTRGSYQARQLVCCSGLQSDRLAKLAGLNIDYKIIPFRGEYYKISDELSGIVRCLIYPVPDPSMPLLGIHLTPMIDGSLAVGPNSIYVGNAPSPAATSSIPIGRMIADKTLNHH